MPPPDDGNEYIPFTQLIALETITPNVFRSIALAFGPASLNRTYGGHVYMQACYAAAQTVAKDMVLHNVAGWFIIAGKANERFTYTVRTLRNGGYSTRAVDVVQESDPGICFSCICSFKIPEKPSVPSLNVQQEMNLRETYKSALGQMHPSEHPEMPGIDTPWYWEHMKNNDNDAFPGLRLRKVDMDAYNKDISPIERRNLKYYSVIGDMPSFKDDPNMHACAHLYASDRNSLFVISNGLGIGDNYSTIASLFHTVIFHADAAEMDMIDHSTGEARWFCQEAWTGGSRHGRGLHESRMWRDDGLHVASTIQDGLVRLKTEDGTGKPGFAPGFENRNVGKSLENRGRGGGKL